MIQIRTMKGQYLLAFIMLSSSFIYVLGASTSTPQVHEEKEEAESKEENNHKALVKKYRADCIKESGVSADLIDKADTGDFVDDGKLKCFSKCFYQKAGLVSENGELLLDVIKSKIPADQHKDKSIASIEMCKDKRGVDACDTVFLVHKCYFESMKDAKEN